MTKKTVWLNTHFNCIQGILAADEDGLFRIVASYPGRKYADVLFADVFEVEPKMDDSAYIQFALDFVQRHKVDIFLPGRRVNEIARHRDAFEALGVKVILVADFAILETLDNKGKFYKAFCPNSFDRIELGVPDYGAVNSLEQFKMNVRARHRFGQIVCYKPTVGIFGQGFKIIETDDNEDLLRGVDRALITTQKGAWEELGRAATFKEQLVMEYLPGVERSVDCLAIDGHLVHCVVRRKLEDGSRVLERHALVEERTARLVEFFKLNGLFNVQFKDKGGMPYLLEINARMSGGINMSCLWGMEFPYWALRVALDPSCIDQIPKPKQGELRVVEVMKAVVVTC